MSVADEVFNVVLPVVIKGEPVAGVKSLPAALNMGSPANDAVSNLGAAVFHAAREPCVASQAEEAADTQ